MNKTHSSPRQHNRRRKHPKRRTIRMKRIGAQSTVMATTAAAMALVHHKPLSTTKTISATHNQATISPSSIPEKKPTPIIASTNIQPAEYQKEFNERKDIDPVQASLAPTFSSAETKYSTLPAASVIAPVISVCGGIVLIAAAMFFIVATKRKRQRNENIEGIQSNKDNDNGFHDISLSDEDDDNSKAMSLKPNFASSRQSTTDTQRPSIPPMPPLSSRTSSITLTSHSRPKSTGSASTASTIYADALSSPMGSIKCPQPPALLKVAERQQLSHERPNIIQTYRAQLAQSVILSELHDPQEQILPFQYYSCIR
ncbi:hypothetical protein BD560DRAFT_405229 [Blakeslea trispora]|nr:hypothetical protein BD560DRAFT_405229 [Blakeslea trispora]